MTLLSPDLDQAEALVTSLMAIPGKTGDEGKTAQFVIEELRAAGLPAEALVVDNTNKKTPVPSDTGNLIVKLPGTRKAPRRLLMAHLDTVPICVGSIPKRDGDRIVSANPASGLGADNRAGCAVILTAACEILRRKLPHPPLTFLFTIQEETGLHGARLIQPSILAKPKLAFNWDGGNSAKVTIGATGGYRMSIDVKGRASHAGVAPEMGVSAIGIASVAIADLVRGGWHGLVEKGRRRGTSNVGVIQGGDATNVVTERVHLRAEARSHDSKFRAKIVAEIERAFQRAVKEVKNVMGDKGSVTFQGRADYEPFRMAEDDPSVVAAAAAIEAVGLTPEFGISNGGLDANWMAVHGIPTVTLGCGQMFVHTTSEALNLEQFRSACRIGLLLATGEGS